MLVGDAEIEVSSFRDPAGFIFTRDDDLYRQINKANCSDYRTLMVSGLYDELVAQKLLVPHEEVDINLAVDNGADCVIQPQKIPYITYPYEWSFSQFKDAALLVLRAQLVALSKGMTLKDASAYNVQFYSGAPILIDTLSFIPYEQGAWVAYRQFCQHFLIPLALMAYRGEGMQKLLLSYIDGISLSTACSLLPFWAFFNYRIFLHIKLHAKYADKLDGACSPVKQESVTRSAGLTKRRLEAMVEDLISLVQSFSLKNHSSQWSEYYKNNNYTDDEMIKKEDVVNSFLSDITRMEGGKIASLQDFGANDGRFSRLALEYASLVVSHDFDGLAVDENYKRCQLENEERILPVITDLSNPSPGIGWLGRERKSFFDRFSSDAGLALALTHHLSIRHHMSFTMQAEFFAGVCRYLIVEYVPKTDKQVSRLLISRDDIFENYSQDGFEEGFSACFCILSSCEVGSSGRVIYLMERKPLGVQ